MVSAAAQRAADTKDYLVTDKGIDASRVMLYTGPADSQTVTTTLVPLGATLDTTGLTPVDESKIKVEGRNRYHILDRQALEERSTLY